MSIKSFDLGTHQLEIDTTNGEVVIYSSGIRMSLGLNSASKLFTGLFSTFLPARFIEDESTDPLQVSTLRDGIDKWERVINHAKILMQRHVHECANCIGTPSPDVLVDCISKAEGVIPYLDEIMVTRHDLLTYASDVIVEYTSTK